MSAFRATDAQLEGEIATVERIARLRLRRATEELRELEGVLRELRRERRRRERLVAAALEASALTAPAGSSSD